MAKAKITVDVKIGISDDTICRCLRILEIWMDDHPNDRIIVDRETTTDGYRHRAYIEWHDRRKEEGDAEQVSQQDRVSARAIL